MLSSLVCPMAYLALVLQQVMRKERIGWTRLQQEPSAQVDTWFTNDLCHHQMGWRGDFLVISMGNWIMGIPPMK